MNSNYPSDWNSRRRRVYRRDNYTCSNCGVKGGGGHDAEPVELHAHHIVPISKGGTHKVSNLKTLCAGCHNAIHHKNAYASTAASSSTPTQAVSEDAVIFVLTALLALPLMTWLGYDSGGIVEAVGVFLLTIIFLVLLSPFMLPEDAFRGS